jgi:hypothetical protein
MNLFPYLLAPRKISDPAEFVIEIAGGVIAEHERKVEEQRAGAAKRLTAYGAYPIKTNVKSAKPKRSRTRKVRTKKWRSEMKLNLENDPIAWAQYLAEHGKPLNIEMAADIENDKQVCFANESAFFVRSDSVNQFTAQPVPGTCSPSSCSHYRSSKS